MPTPAREWLGFATNPAALLEQTFSEIAQGEMQTLPFFRAQVPVRALGFQCYEGQWVGVMLTPWMLSILVLPGPDQVWDSRPLGERLGLRLPFGNAVFHVSEIETIGQYLSCSLMSPLDPAMSAEQALQLATDVSRQVLAIPVTDVNAPQNLSRRALLSGRRYAAEPQPQPQSVSK
ncbi:hydrogenase-2 assembly chaperone [Plesiomonas shigelloides]